jgi:propanediol utilization protein
MLPLLDWQIVTVFQGKLMPPSSWLRSIVKFYSLQSNAAVIISNYTVHLSLEVFEKLFVTSYVNNDVTKREKTPYYKNKRLETIPRILEC